MIDYDYDPLYRLTAADYSTGDSYAYTYDAVGNRLTQASTVSGLSSTVQYDYDDANRLTEVNGVPYTWDNNGNLLNDGLNAYTYDSANRLKTMTGPSVAASYEYNGMGDRLQEILNGQPTTFTMDLNTGLTQALSDGTNTYIYGNGRIAQVNSGTEYFLGDALGSVRQLTNSSGAVTYAGAYDPYGVTTQTYGASQTAYGYTNEYTGQGLIYLRARHYIPGMGRFLTRDPSAAEANLYLYASANPTNYTDPSGLFSQKEVAEAIGLYRDGLNPYNGNFNDFLDKIERETPDFHMPKWGLIAALLDAKPGDRIEAYALDIYNWVPSSGTYFSIYNSPSLALVSSMTFGSDLHSPSAFSFYVDSMNYKSGSSWMMRGLDARYYKLYGRNNGSYYKVFVDGSDHTDYPDFKITTLNVADSIKASIVELAKRAGKKIVNPCLSYTRAHIVDRYGQIYKVGTVNVGPGFSLVGLGEGWVSSNIWRPRYYIPDPLTLRGKIEGFSFGPSGIFFEGASLSYSPGSAAGSLILSGGLAVSASFDLSWVTYIDTDPNLAWDWADQLLMGAHGSPPTIFKSMLPSRKPQ